MKLDHERLFRSIPASCMMLDTKLRYVDATERYLETVNRTLDELRDMYVFDAFPEKGERLAMFKDAFERAVNGEANSLVRQPYSIPVAEKDGGGVKEVWWNCHQTPVYAQDGSVCGMIQQAVDITAEVKAQEMEGLLGRELNHRVKNLFSLVQALVTMSARGQNDAQALAEKIRERVAALAAAHVVSAEAGELAAVSLFEIVHGVLAPYETGNLSLDPDQEDVEIPRRAVTPVGLILHELATNAVKYGALSHVKGTVRISWIVEPTASDHRRVIFSWTEINGEPSRLRQDGKPGFGSRLMGDSARQLGGSLEQSWSDEGLDTLFTFDVHN